MTCPNCAAAEAERDTARREADIQLGEKLAAQITLKAITDALCLPLAELGNGWTEATQKILARIEEIVDEENRLAAERDVAIQERDEARERGQNLVDGIGMEREMRKDAERERDIAIQERDEARRDGWYVETLPSGEGAEELAKARRGEGLSVDETGSALRAAMEVADAAKQRGMAAEREARRWMQAATTTCLACSEARERMHEAEDDARIAERETTAALGLVDRQRERTENAEARLERVEAAATMLLEAVAHEEVITGDTLGAWTSLRAALSDVTPPPSGAAGAVDE